ncbi:MAG TPA: PAS domain S-box protein [Syntrophobacter fumaroxidans]|nr:PAS domain S-box protein [Syntrophobacter fumaroxidans]
MSIPEDKTVELPSEAIIRDILASVTDAVITVDENHNVVYCNQSAEKMFGWRRDEITGRDVSPLIPDPHHDMHRQYVQRYVDTGIARVIGEARECRGQRKDGTTFPVEISYSLSRTGGHLFFTAVIRDITQRKEMEREVRFMETLADVGKAVAHIGHEIRKPLVLIGGFAGQVERCDSLRASEKDRRKLRIIMDEIKRLETLLSSIRVLTRPPSSSHKSSLSLNAVVESTLELLTPMLKDRKIQLKKDLSADRIMVHGDPNQLEQVFLNLLDNAIGALRHSGTVTISSVREKDTARVVVEDDGPGIPEELQERIFDPFFTTKPDGTGLGLPICRNIIREHGGMLTLHSSTSRGTRFIVELPLSP